MNAEEFDLSIWLLQVLPNPRGSVVRENMQHVYERP